MCEASAYLLNGEKTELVMDAVDQITPDQDGLRLTNIFGDQKFIKAHLHSLSLVDHKVYLTPK